MKCGVCKQPEVTVEHVRACSKISAREEFVQPVAPKPVVKTLAQEPVAGIYVIEGSIFKVQESQNGHFYAKQWLHTAGEWEYAGRAPLYRLTVEHKMSAEQAKQFGDLYGNCVFCGRRLTDERSIDAGYGPVCAEHNGLPWGE